MKFEVDKALVEPIIREQIAAAVVAQLGDTTELVRKMVMVSLSKKVDEEGNVNSSSYYNKHDLIESLAGKAIREAAAAAVRKVIADQQPAIEKAVADHLRKSPKETAAAIVAAFAKGVGSDYRLTAKFEISHVRG